MLKWLLALGLVFFLANLVLSSSDDSLREGAELKRKALTEIQTIREECVRYAGARGELPDRLDRAEGIDPLDPWGRPYRYRRTDPLEAEVVSLGADGMEGGIGLDADLVSKIRIG
ncbi:MAG: type II secretion system protein GspG [Planctomycetota bacterium]